MTKLTTNLLFWANPPAEDQPVPRKFGFCPIAERWKAVVKFLHVMDAGRERLAVVKRVAADIWPQNA